MRPVANSKGQNLTRGRHSSFPKGSGRRPENFAKVLRHGGIGVLPTDTIYGIVGSALSKRAVKRIYKVKGRNFKKPLIVLIAGYSDLARFGVRPTAEQKKLLRSVWKEGKRPTSVILPAPGKKFAYLHRGAESIAFRRPNVASLLRLLRRAGPLVAPSANPEGQRPAATIEEAIAYFGEGVDFYADGGRKQGKPSCLVAFRQGRIEILR